MFHPFRSGLFAALCVLCLLPFAGVFAAPATPSIGVIDLDQVAQKYKGYQNANDRFQVFRESRKQLFDAMKNGMYLSKDEFDEYVSRAGDTTKLDAERIKQLENLAKKNQDEYQALKAKEKDKLTDADSKRLAELEKNLSEVTPLLQERSTQMQEEIEGEFGHYSQSLTKLVNDALGEVAKKMKLSIVLSKTLQTQEGEAKFVLWGGTDMTDDVIKYLNDNYKPTLLDPEKKK